MCSKVGAKYVEIHRASGVGKCAIVGCTGELQAVGRRGEIGRRRTSRDLRVGVVRQLRQPLEHLRVSRRIVLCLLLQHGEDLSGQNCGNQLDGVMIGIAFATEALIRLPRFRWFVCPDLRPYDLAYFLASEVTVWRFIAALLSSHHRILSSGACVVTSVLRAQGRLGADARGGVGADCADGVARRTLAAPSASPRETSLCPKYRGDISLHACELRAFDRAFRE